MKRLIIILALGLFLSNTSFSINDGKKTKLKLALTEIVKFPKKLDLNCKNNHALIDITVDNNGVISVNEINACPELKNYIITQVEGYKLIDYNGLVDKSYQYKFVFAQ